MGNGELELDPLDQSTLRARKRSRRRDALSYGSADREASPRRNESRRAEGVLTARVQLPAARYDFPTANRLFGESLARIAALPGVENLAGTRCVPLAGPCIGTGFDRADRPRPSGQAPSAQVRPITPACFKTMGIPQVAGRDFSASDTTDSVPVAIVSEALVKEEFADEAPVGRRLRINVTAASGRTDVEWMVVGVVGDIKLSSLEGAFRPTIYVPTTQLPGPNMSFIVRT
ncbi:MAG: ABC transporter permease, partial [Burkholderiales bacterium]